MAGSVIAVEFIILAFLSEDGFQSIDIRRRRESVFVSENTEKRAIDTVCKSHRGDRIAIRSAGAYGQVMASHYNMRPLAPSVYSDRLAEAPRKKDYFLGE